MYMLRGLAVMIRLSMVDMAPTWLHIRETACMPRDALLQGSLALGFACQHQERQLSPPVMLLHVLASA